MIYKGKFKIIENEIAACDYGFLLSQTEKKIEKNQPLLISPIASHTLVKAKQNKKLKKILDGFNFLVPDSQWIRWSLKFLYQISLPDRVYGPELMKKVLQISSRKKYKVMFYGTKEKTLKKLENKIKEKLPQLKIVVKEPSLFRDLSDKEWDKLINKILLKKPKIIFVSLGSPLQEEFACELNKKLIEKKFACVIIPVGAAFDFLAGVKKQAPKWMGDLGLEWLFRLIQEPKRLRRRYVIDGVVFVFFVLFQKKIIMFYDRFLYFAGNIIKNKTHRRD